MQQHASWLNPPAPQSSCHPPGPCHLPDASNPKVGARLIDSSPWRWTGWVLIYGIADAPKLAPRSDESDTLMCSIEVPTTCRFVPPHPQRRWWRRRTSQDSWKQKAPPVLWQLVKLVVLSIAPPSGALPSNLRIFKPSIARIQQSVVGRVQCLHM